MEFGRVSVIQENPLPRSEYVGVRGYKAKLPPPAPTDLHPKAPCSDGYSPPTTANHSYYGVESDQSDPPPPPPALTRDPLNLSQGRMDHCPSKSTSHGRCPSGGSGSSTSASPTSSHGGRNSTKTKKLCEVCGDIAKSLHFGGLSCDSCKAFFRRSVHKDAYLQFSCGYDNACLINKQTRKGCQKCRFVKCMAIGMEMKWVMSEDERKQLNKQRIAKKSQASSPSDESGTEGSYSPTKPHVTAPNPAHHHHEYSPMVEHMLHYMSAQEQRDIKDACEFYRVSYERIPYSVPQSTEGIRNSLQVIGMFTTILRRFAYFSKLVPEFQGLNREDQGTLLKASVLEMVMLRGALSFDVENHRWPNTNLEFLVNCPQLRVEDMENLVSHELFEMHMKFIKRLQTLKVDEPTNMLLILIVMFSPERPDLQDVQSISSAQERYCALLKKYVNWRYGPSGAMLYPKLLTQLSDLRQLNDLHTEYNLNLAEREVNVIRQDLSQLKLEPYPQWKIVNPGDTSSRAEASPQFPTESSQFSPPGPIRPSHRTHSRMREAFLRRIPDLIDDPFGPLMSMDEMMSMAGGGGFVLPPAPTSPPAADAFDPWQHRHHTSQQRPPSSTRSQEVDQSPVMVDPALFDLDKLQNIQSIMESLNPETLSKLQCMFFPKEGGGVAPTHTGITPGLFANLLTAEKQLQNQASFESSSSTRQPSPH